MIPYTVEYLVQSHILPMNTKVYTQEQVDALVERAKRDTINNVADNVRDNCWLSLGWCKGNNAIDLIRNMTKDVK